jgi:CheY-like chemotaxis protein
MTELLWERAQSSMEMELLAEQQLEEGAEPASPVEQAGDADPQALFAATTWRLIQLGELIEELLPVIQPLAGRHEVVVQPQGLYDLPPVRGDRVMLRQALLNVLTFAIASTTTPHVAVTGQSHPEQIVVRVAFDVERADRGRVDLDGRRLTLAAQIMEAVGGSLTEEAAPGMHTIWLRWPSVHQKTLLMVDDNEGLVDLFRRYLANESWQILWAKNGQAARQAIEHTAPSAILLDIMMPEEDGWEVLLALRQHPVTQHTPILICSVVNEPSLAESLGAAGYLPKPVSQEALLSALAEWQ